MRITKEPSQFQNITIVIEDENDRLLILDILNFFLHGPANRFENLLSEIRIKGRTTFSYNELDNALKKIISSM